MAGRVFGLGDILGVIMMIPPLGIRPEAGPDMKIQFVSDGSLIEHLCGDVHPMEYGMVLKAAREELVRQLPWLRRVVFPCEVERIDWVVLWCWVDALGERHGHEHPVEPLPREWREGIAVSSFEGYDEYGTRVSFGDLPGMIQSILLRLGYKNDFAG